MKHKHLVAASAALVLLSPTSYAVTVGTNLLTNGGAEDGTLADPLLGWTADLSDASSGQDEIIAAVTSQTHVNARPGGLPPLVLGPAEGEFFFSFANEATCATGGCGETVSLFQTGTSIAEGLPYVFAGNYSNVERSDIGGADDLATVTLAFFDGSGGLLDGTSETLPNSGNNVWADFSLTLAAPEGAAEWRVTMAGVANQGTFTNVYFDDASLTAVPLPPAAILFASAIAGLTLVGRKLSKKGEQDSGGTALA